MAGGGLFTIKNFIVLYLKNINIQTGPHHYFYWIHLKKKICLSCLAVVDTLLQTWLYCHLWSVLSTIPGVVYSVYWATLVTSLYECRLRAPGHSHHHTDSAAVFIATLDLHLGFSVTLRIWQVTACKMEPRSGNISWKKPPTHPATHPPTRPYGFSCLIIFPDTLKWNVRCPPLDF